MILSQFDYQMYMDEIAELRVEMTQLLISMEYRHQTNPGEEFDRWWYGDENAENGGINGGIDDGINDEKNSGISGGMNGETNGGTNGTETDRRSRGNMERYFAMKRRIEQIEGFLSRVQVEEQTHPKMRHGGKAVRKEGEN